MDRAKGELRKKAQSTWVLGGIFAILLVASFTISIPRKEFYGPLSVLLLFGIFFFAYGHDYWTTKRKIAEALGSGKGNPALSGHPQPPSTLVQGIQSLSRPRLIRLRFEGRISALLFLMALAIFAAFAFVAIATIRGGSLTSTGSWPLLALLLIIGTALAGAITFKVLKDWRNCNHLLRLGDVTAAKVVEQQVIDYGRYSYNRITYEFSAPGSLLIRKTEHDHTKQVFEDMLIPVFYDPASPRNCTALCATYYRFPDAEI